MDSQNIDVIRENGGIEALIKVLHESSQEAQAYAVYALGNMAMYTENSDVIRQGGIVQALIKALREGSQQIQSYAADALGDLALNVENADVLPEDGGVLPLIKVLHGDSPETQATAAYALQTLALTSQNANVIRKQGGIQALIKIVREGGPEAQVNAAYALRNLIQNSNDADVVHEEGGVQPLFKVLYKQKRSDGLNMLAKLGGKVLCAKLRKAFGCPYVEPDAKRELMLESEIQQPSGEPERPSVQVAELHIGRLQVVASMVAAAACITVAISGRWGRPITHDNRLPFLAL